MVQPSPFDGEDNPLASSDPRAFDRLIEAIGPASMLVVIRARMSQFLQERLEPEDIWQETLVHAWRDRARCEWRGLKSFRRWLLQIIENRLRDASDREEAFKRGARLNPTALAQDDGSTRGSTVKGETPLASTTPSRIAMHREEALLMQEALEALSDDVREIVRLRLFEETPIHEVAACLKLNVHTAKQRLRKGLEEYRRLLAAALRSRSSEGDGPRGH